MGKKSKKADGRGSGTGRARRRSPRVQREREDSGSSSGHEGGGGGGDDQGELITFFLCKRCPGVEIPEEGRAEHRAFHAEEDRGEPGKTGPLKGKGRLVFGGKGLKGARSPVPSSLFEARQAPLSTMAPLRINRQRLAAPPTRAESMSVQFGSSNPDPHESAPSIGSLETMNTSSLPSRTVVVHNYRYQTNNYSRATGA